MTSEPTRPPRVLIVGAYERDNVGDLLFLLVTEQYLPHAEVFSTAPFSADMTALLDRQVHAYGPLLQAETFDVIWTAGGQVGGTDLKSAFRMSASQEDYRAYQKGSVDERAEILRRVAGEVPIVSPYMPSAIAYPLNASSISVLNSVGVGGIRAVEPVRREELVALLRGQTLISVRDQASSDYLTSLDIEHRLVPDAVHAIGILHPKERDPGSDVVIFQASTHILGQLGHANVAAKLAHSPHLKGLRIRLLLAGTATGHDSYDDYSRLIEHVKEIAPETDIEILDERRPMDLVDRISEARLVIGTSLHVRILACAYAIPRVTLARTKPTQYARRWDPDMPYGVTLDGLDDAMATALANGDKPELIAHAADLARLAHDNLADMAHRVMTLAENETAEDKALRLKIRTQHQTALIAGRTARGAEIARLELELRRAQKELAAIRSSRTYRLAARGARVGRAIRRTLRRAS